MWYIVCYVTEIKILPLLMYKFNLSQRTSVQCAVPKDKLQV